MKKIYYFILLCILSATASSQWVPLNSGTSNRIIGIFFVNSTTGTALEFNGNVRKTTNSGLNWTAQPSGINQNTFGIFYINESTGFLCGDGGIHRSTDGGTSWNIISAPSSYYRGLYFTNALTGYAGGSPGVIAKTTNGGANWFALSTGTTDFIFRIKFANEMTGYAATVEGNILKTVDGGSNWTISTIGVTASFYGLAVLNADTVTVCGDNGVMARTTSGGANWTVQNSSTNNLLFNLVFVNSETGTACGHNNTIIRTTNGGANWIHQSSGLTGVGIEGVFFTSAQTGFLTCTDGNILYTTTGGFPLPTAPVLIYPVNGAINISPTATLDWDTATAGRTYRVQLGPDSNFATPLLDSQLIVQSSMQIPSGLLGTNTLYYWRVQSENAGGIGPWSLTFRFRTLPPIPLAPGLLLPVDGASNVSLTPLFDWDSNSTAVYYTLQASLDTGFSNPPVFINNIPHSFLNLTSPALQNNYRYYWRVNTTNPAGTGPWSAVFNFTTVFGPPSAPTHLAPPDNSTGISLTPALDWVDDISAISYGLQLSQDSTFAASLLIDTAGVVPSTLTLRPGLLLNVRKYYWRVRTLNSFGLSAWSAPWNFTTLLAPPIAPVLVDPPNNSVDISTTPTLDWDTVEFAETYRVQVSTSPVFSDTLINSGGNIFSQFNVPGGFLLNNTTYYWRVNGTNTAGTGPYSAIWNFKTIVSPPVAAPVLLAPPNGAANVVLTPTLDWNDVYGVTGYKVNVSEDPLFNTVLIDSTIGTASQFTIPAGKLSGSTSYYWRIRGFNVGGFGPWSVTWNFNTMVIGISVIGNEIPKEFRLYNNYPNPFNPLTKIKFDIPAVSGVNSLSVRLTVYDITGKEAAIILNKDMQPGKYEADWNASGFASGIYFYRLETSEFVDIKKMVLLK
ncbi:MAG: T9SS type A sorting domain-containing protein [Ignavibacteria bacterium]|nr:T9SS type A sorting domain-containing protein [Ignavibacteria bacterium]